ncbi:hypothetical protein FCT18_08995 [Lysinibacillus sphaericus]|uniref:Uncharacterized protein n=3 Tax=Lysinibacillus TaxID=400634 RepID=A0A2S5CZ15_LYSSH|nr:MULTISPECIES: hypothetical protein [Lysinibacillus]AHN22200.1 hypothetical protein T479_13420 [Lysinibacillus varians]AVK96559.1 hypothetical protein LS41612_09930 [Lysinibacillus sphaericus]MCS1381940.1 hypothetical protein [Lysinibacillus sphaericus]MED4542910.1 hypothetical protein [Lysinibacillus sphaericus]OEC00735.1 hypothetical protein GY31_18105 [Lysinibacillus sphaericus]
MKDPKKAKWLLGASGVLISAALLSQFNDTSQAETTDAQFSKIEEKAMTKKEKELVQLDWTNFEITKQTAVKSERKTKRT